MQTSHVGPTRRDAPSRGRATWVFVPILAALLGVVSLWPIRATGDWIAGNISTARQLRPLDGLGEAIFPVLAIFAVPALAALGSLVGPYAVLLVFSSPADRAFGILTKAALAQGTVALAIYLTGPPANAVAGWLLSAFENVRSANPIVASDVIARQEAATAVLLPALAGTTLAYLLGAALSEYVRARSAASELVASVAEGDLRDVPPELDVRLLNAPPQPPSPASALFKHTTYDVRPRSGVTAAFLRRGNDYDIQTSASAASQEHYSYSMDSGALRMEPDGPVLLVMKTQERSEGMTSDITDAAGSLIATIVFQSAGCEINDTSGRPLLTVLRIESQVGQALYVATDAGRDVARYTWSSGITALQSLLHVELDARPSFDRALAIVVAPCVEEEARLRSVTLYQRR